MAIFRTNQARQFYVSTDRNITVNTTKNNQVYFTVEGEGGITRSDLIPLSNVLYAKVSAPKPRFLKEATVTLADGIEIIGGQEYLLRVKILGYLSMAEEPAILKYGVVHATKGMKATNFYREMAMSLANNIGRTDTELLKVYLTTSAGRTEVVPGTKVAEGEYTGIVISEVKQEYERGKHSSKGINFEAWSNVVTLDSDGSEGNWSEDIKVVNSTTSVTNGEVIADMEYFYMGERADHYRNNDSRNALTTKYMVDPSASYHTLDIHYYFVDSNEGSQRSEKDIIVVSTSEANLEDIVTALTAGGVKMQ